MTSAADSVAVLTEISLRPVTPEIIHCCYQIRYLQDQSIHKTVKTIKDSLAAVEENGMSRQKLDLLHMAARSNPQTLLLLNHATLDAYAQAPGLPAHQALNHFISQPVNGSSDSITSYFHSLVNHYTNG